mgnify:CR=1 FL=1
MLHRLAEKGLLEAEEQVVEGKVRKYYAPTEEERAALEEIRPKIRELVAEVVEAEGPGSITDEGEL